MVSVKAWWKGLSQLHPEGQSSLLQTRDTTPSTNTSREARKSDFIANSQDFKILAKIQIEDSLKSNPV